MLPRVAPVSGCLRDFLPFGLALVLPAKQQSRYNKLLQLRSHHATRLLIAGLSMTIRPLKFDQDSICSQGLAGIQYAPPADVKPLEISMS
jgi:hypothetical protein